MSKIGWRPGKCFFTFLSAWLLFVGICQYRHTWAFFAQGPSWASQVRDWRKDHAKQMTAWPAGDDGWKFPLDPP
jgi:hypothetical protein